MLIYSVSKNCGLGENRHACLAYLGTSVREAEDVVGDFQKFAKLERQGGFPPIVNRKQFSALPKELDREMIQFFIYSFRWYSIEMFELE